MGSDERSRIAFPMFEEQNEAAGIRKRERPQKYAIDDGSDDDHLDERDGERQYDGDRECLGSRESAEQCAQRVDGHTVWLIALWRFTGSLRPCGIWKVCGRQETVRASAWEPERRVRTWLLMRCRRGSRKAEGPQPLSGCGPSLMHHWGGWTRTTNFLINSQAVCQLTYTPSWRTGRITIDQVTSRPHVTARTGEPSAADASGPSSESPSP
jgi:hypothetical protein